MSIKVDVGWRHGPGKNILKKLKTYTSDFSGRISFLPQSGKALTIVFNKVKDPTECSGKLLNKDGKPTTWDEMKPQLQEFSLGLYEQCMKKPHKAKSVSQEPCRVFFMLLLELAREPYAGSLSEADTRDAIIVALKNKLFDELIEMFQARDKDEASKLRELEEESEEWKRVKMELAAGARRPYYDKILSIKASIENSHVDVNI